MSLTSRRQKRTGSLFKLRWSGIQRSCPPARSGTGCFAVRKCLFSPHKHSRSESSKCTQQLVQTASSTGSPFTFLERLFMLSYFQDEFKEGRSSLCKLTNTMRDKLVLDWQRGKSWCKFFFLFFLAVFIIKENEIHAWEQKFRSRSRLRALSMEVTGFCLTSATPFGLWVQ